MQDPPFSPREKILVLRLNRLRHLPPAQSAVEILAENGLPLLIVEYGQGAEAQTWVEGPLPTLRLPHAWLSWLPGKLRVPVLMLSVFIRLGRLFTNHGKPRVIFAHGLQENALAWLFHWFFGVEYVLQVHESYEAGELRSFNRFLFSMEGFFLRRARFLIFPEQTRARIYQERYRILRPVFVAANAPRLRFQGPPLDLRARLGLGPDAVLLLYMGGLGDVNCLEEGIRALAAVPRVHFLLCGWGGPEDMERYRRAAAEAGVEKRVHFLGPTSQKWEFYDNCDIAYCVYRGSDLRSRHQATASNKLLEAMAAGLAVVVNSRPDFLEFLRQYEVGVAAEDLSSVAIAQSLKRLAEDEVGRRRYGEQGLEWHRKLFNYEAQFSKILEEFYRLAGSAEGAGESALRDSP